jgi:hypothetical protein
LELERVNQEGKNLVEQGTVEAAVEGHLHRPRCGV